VLLGAHDDSVIGSPGADDNASGVAALLEVARRFTTLEPERTVRFVAFVNEEPPFFMTDAMGSRVYASMARRRGRSDRVDDLPGVARLLSKRSGSQRYPPLLGLCYPTRSGFVACLSAPALVSGVGWSDHASFRRQGYRAVMVTDIAFYRYPWYHTSAGLPDRLDYGAMAHVIEGLAESTDDLAGR